LEARTKFSSGSTGDALAAYRSSLEGGNAVRGRELFHEKTEFLCVRCHKIEGGGTSEVGPDLTGIGQHRSREYLLRAIVDPGADIAAGFEFATVQLTDGRTVSGLVTAESPTEIKLATSADPTASPNRATATAILKSEIKSRRATSPMPALVSLMTPRELRDLVEYLATARVRVRVQ
jgi:putative heme-binding domain-containing protein